MIYKLRRKTHHDCLAAHLHKINICNSPACTICKDPTSRLNVDHLLQCSGIKPTRRTESNLPMIYLGCKKE
ncbi:hypothetical protein C0J52_12088 [Blattella germanica]|nr:hypothetical protein C0J52_12088 [Blattella germanica]